MLRFYLSNISLFYIHSLEMLPLNYLFVSIVLLSLSLISFIFFNFFLFLNLFLFLFLFFANFEVQFFIVLLFSYKNILSLYPGCISIESLSLALLTNRIRDIIIPINSLNVLIDYFRMNAMYASINKHFFIFSQL